MTSRIDHRARPAATAKRRPGPSRKSGFGGTLLGMFVGIALGLALAAGVAFYLMKAGNPYQSAGPAREPQREAAKDPARSTRTDAGAVEKPRFDFYKILPGAEEPATDQQVKDAQKQSTPAVKETFYLQAGAFQSAPDADNLKARLALLGIQALVQTATLPDKGVWHRVRVGPYTSVEELNQTRDTLKQNGVETALIKVRE